MQCDWKRLALAMLMACPFGDFMANAQNVQPPQKNRLSQEIQTQNSIAKFSVSLSNADAKVGEEITLAIRATIAMGWHIGATTGADDSLGFPTQIEFTPVGLEPLEDHFTPSVEPRELSLEVGKQLFMQGDFTWTRKYRVTAMGSKYGGKGSVRFQACDNTKCLPPQTAKFELGDTQRASTPADRPAATEPTTTATKLFSEKTVGDSIVLQLEPCNLKRTRPQLNVSSIVALLLVGRPTDSMVWKGTIPTGPDEGISIYLPKAATYSLENTGTDDTIVGNTATYVSIDQDGDGRLAEWEAAAVNRPIRIRDSMYRVQEISSDNRTMTIQQLDVPLKGSLVGFRCPEFELTTLDGSVISNRSILGKTTVLDIWAVTCHNCYEGFPKIRRSLEKHGPDKLRVILLTVDTDRQFYDSQAPRLFQTYGGGDWPQIMLPGGFNGALTFGDYGFGSVVVDDQGIVRAVGALSFNIEPLIDQVIRESADRR